MFHPNSLRLTGVPVIAAVRATIASGLQPFYADLLEESVPGDLLALAIRVRGSSTFSGPAASEVITGTLEPDVAERLIMAQRSGALDRLAWATPNT